MIMELTGGLGVDVAVEAVGVPGDFELCTAIVRPGGQSRERRCPRPFCDAPPGDAVDSRRHDHDRPRRHDDDAQLLKLIQERRLDPTPFATHRFALADTETAYDVFAAAAETNALKVVLTAEPVAALPKHSATPEAEPVAVG